MEAPPIMKLSPSVISRVEVFEHVDECLRQRWRDFAAIAVHTSYQSLEWYEAWIDTVGAIIGETPFVVFVFDQHDRQIMLLPLVIIKRRFACLCRFPGGKHANTNFPLVSPNLPITCELVQALFKMLSDEHPEIDLFIFDAQPIKWKGTDNPFLLLPHHLHTAASSDLDLSKLPPVRKHNADRRFAKLGAQFFRARTDYEISETLEAFLRQKAAWFRLQGLPYGFNQPRILEFFKILFAHPTSGAELYALKIGTEIIAVAGLLTAPQDAFLMFTSYDATLPVAKHGPGTHLFNRLISHLCERNFQWFDLGLGEAAYKEKQGAERRDAFVVFLPASALGFMIAALVNLKRATKRVLKSRPGWQRPAVALYKFGRAISWSS
jgi:CelD/BcsL family acetyltransferase involved in cellulose biosynthesis